MDKKYFNKLSEKLEKLFPKREHCQCGKRLSCRSKSLSFNAYANIYHDDILEKQIKDLIEKVEKIDKHYKVLKYDKDIFNIKDYNELNEKQKQRRIGLRIAIRDFKEIIKTQR